MKTEHHCPEITDKGCQAIQGNLNGTSIYAHVSPQAPGLAFIFGNLKKYLNISTNCLKQVHSTSTNCLKWRYSQVYTLKANLKVFGKKVIASVEKCILDFQNLEISEETPVSDGAHGAHGK